jgi:F-type H+-transporting ATPase subunit epsilon
MEQILYGKPVAEFIDQKTLSFLNSLPKDKEKVHMTAITVGDNPASLLYVSRKKDKAVELGIDFHWEKLNSDTSQIDLNKVIAELSENTDGLIVQLPLPDHLDVVETINQIPVELDVDGLTTQNLGMLFSDKQILELLVASGSNGELGVTYGHTPLLTDLIPGTVRVVLQGGEEEVYYVSGGYLEVQGDVVTILANTAVRGDDLDEVAAEEARKAAEEALANQSSELDYGRASAQLAEAAAQLATLRKLKNRAGR